MSKTKKRRRLVGPRNLGQLNRWPTRPLLQHHHHSFKLLHRRHTSYPLVAFLLLLTGVFCLGWTGFASGGTYVVNAVVPAPPLTTPATITAPVDGSTTGNQIISARGTCPARSYVKLLRDQTMIGASQCTNGEWSLQVSLLVGANRLSAQAYNLTDQPGPTADGVVVTYTPPAPKPVPQGSTGTGSPKPAPAAKPLTIGNDFQYKGYFTDQTVSLTLSLAGGVTPYALQVDWGDGQTDLRSVKTETKLTLHHVYDRPPVVSNGYIITVTVSDGADVRTLLQLFAVVSPLPGGPANQEADNGLFTPGSRYGSFWSVAGPTLAIALVALISFWLGERREFELLHQASKRKYAHR